MAPQFVKPYVKSNKNDATDAEAIWEALARPNMRLVGSKTVEQQDIQAVYRIRSELVHSIPPRSIRYVAYGVNTVLLLHNGWLQCVKRCLCCWKMPGKVLSKDVRPLLEELKHDLTILDKQISDMDARIQRLVNDKVAAKRLQQIPGIGPITATALICAVGDGK
jgi:transposase